MKFRIFLLVFLAILLAAFWYISTGYFSSGERAGTLSKLSERGYIFKTYEGVLNEGGYSGETGTLQPRYWDFSTVADSVITDLRKALGTGERVTLIYQEKFVRFPWNGDTKYFITKVIFKPQPERPVYQDYEEPAQLPQPQPALPQPAPLSKDTLAVAEPV
ncbi:hypothetical protein [uncultured Arcticibacterium sp.]|uniref:hypothetical protein n=1 Tax=uncultured Arcticibacterium sp. TaxID=2173042 RepID=UPI0030FC3286